MRKTTLVIIALLLFSTFSTFAPQVKAESDVITLPAGAWHPGGIIDPNSGLDRIDMDPILPGDQQVITVSPGETITFDYWAWVYGWGSGGYEIRQLWFTYSWASSWPPWDAYTGIYDGIPHGTKNVDGSVSITVPTTLGTYKVWLCVESHYSMSQAVAQLTEEPTMLPHAIITVVGADYRLTTNPYDDYDPSWSPDGTKIVYKAFAGSWNRHIWVMNNDGSSKTQLTSGSVVDAGPAYSPDGTEIAFARWGFRGDYFDLMIMNTDGTNVRRVTFSGIPGKREGSFERPRWSEDGTKLVFQYNEGTTGAGSPSIGWWVGTINVDGSGLEVLNRGMFPRFCYGDTKILFHTDPFYPDGQCIALMNTDGTGMQILTDGPLDRFPHMSSTTNRILFNRYRDLYVMDEDGSNLASITSDGTNGFAEWSPDEKYIAYESDKSGNVDIWKMEAPEELLSLPAGATNSANGRDTETILLSIDVDSKTSGDQQVVTASPGETITVTATFQVWSSGGPGIIKQAFFIYSWTPSWPPSTAYYASLYNGQPGYHPGVTLTTSFSVTVPQDMGNHYLWFCLGAHYSMELAVNEYKTPLTLPAHAKIVVVSLHPAIEMGLESLSSLETGVLAGAEIVDGETLGTAIEVAKMVVDFIPVPSTKILIMDIAAGTVIETTAGALLEKIKDVADIDTLQTYYTTGDFSATIGMWKDDVVSLNDVFLSNADKYSTEIEFIADMQAYHQHLKGVGANYVDQLNSIIEAHDWWTFQRDIIICGGGIVISIITYGAAFPFVVAVLPEIIYSGITGISNIKEEAHFFKALSVASLQQQEDALYFAQQVGEGIEYLAAKLESDDLSFPELRLEPIPGGGTWIWNDYSKDVKVKLVHSVTLTCYEEQTIEPPRRHYEVPYGEFTIHPGAFLLFLPSLIQPPPDVKRWRDHLESFGYSVEDWSSLQIFYGEEGFHAMKTTPLPVRETMLSVMAESPVNLLVEDQNGLRVGYDSESQTVVNEINGATYSGPGTEPQAITIPSPIDGDYTIDAFGTGMGTYTITMESVAADGSVVDTETWTGTTSLGELDRNDVHLSEDGNIVELPPSIDVQTPSEGQALQDGVTLEATVSDPTGVDWVTFSIRESDGTVIDPMFESMSPTHLGNETWTLSFDTTQLPDGYYLFLVNASDPLGNEGYKTVDFSIRNWACVELLPASEPNKGGRTMPVKFSLRVVAAVDPAQPFVWNEELTILIYEQGHPEDVLQNSTYGIEARDYRIDPDDELYITNFRTLKRPATYVVEIYRKEMLIGSFEFSTVK